MQHVSVFAVSEAIRLHGWKRPDLPRSKSQTLSEALRRAGGRCLASRPARLVPLIDPVGKKEGAVAVAEESGAGSAHTLRLALCPCAKSGGGGTPVEKPVATTANP